MGREECQQVEQRLFLLDRCAWTPLNGPGTSNVSARPATYPLQTALDGGFIILNPAFFTTLNSEEHDLTKLLTGDSQPNYISY